jgi:ribosomal-protein-serine acetyltransferase
MELPISALYRAAIVVGGNTMKTGFDERVKWFEVAEDTGMPQGHDHNGARTHGYDGLTPAKGHAIPLAYFDGQLAIRRFESEDVSSLFEGIEESINELSEWMVWCHPDYSRKDAATFVSSSRDRWKKGEAYSFGIYEVKSGELLGSVGLNCLNRTHNFANLGYWVRSSRTRQGIGARAARLGAQFGFRVLQLNRLEFLIPLTNHPSQRVAEHVGARAEGILRNRLILNNRSHNAVLYSLLEKDLPLLS